MEAADITDFIMEDVLSLDSTTPPLSAAGIISQSDDIAVAGCEIGPKVSYYWLAE